MIQPKRNFAEAFAGGRAGRLGRRHGHTVYGLVEYYKREMAKMPPTPAVFPQRYFPSGFMR
jgi:hypothetical protein